MKLKKYLSFGILGLAVLAVPGCQQVQDWFSGFTQDEAKIEQVAIAFETGTRMVVRSFVADNPETSQYFESAVLALKAALDANDLSPDAVVSNIETYLDAQFAGEYTPVVLDVLRLAVTSYQRFYELNVSVEVEKLDPALRRLLTSIATGIETGIVVIDTAAAPRSNPLENLSDEDLKL